MIETTVIRNCNSEIDQLLYITIRFIVFQHILAIILNTLKPYWPTNDCMCTKPHLHLFLRAIRRRLQVACSDTQVSNLHWYSHTGNVQKKTTKRCRASKIMAPCSQSIIGQPKNARSVSNVNYYFNFNCILISFYLKYYMEY